MDHIINLDTTLNYRGNYPDITKFVNQGIFEVGNLVTCGEDTYLFNGDDWSLISKVDTLGTQPEPLPSTITEVKCKCCGAPLPQVASKYSGIVKCEYCGSVYSY